MNILGDAVPKRVSPAMVHRLAELSGLPESQVQKIIQDFWKTKGHEHYDTHMLFQHAKNNGYYKQMSRKEKDIAAFRCLTMLERSLAEEMLRSTTPSGNIVHALERLFAKSVIQEHQLYIYMSQYLLGCSLNSGIMCAADCDSIPEVLNVAKQSGIIDDRARGTAIHAYFFLVDPSEAIRVACGNNTELHNFQESATRIESHGLANANIARIRRWQPVPRDEIRKIFDIGRGASDQETRREVLIQRLMEKDGADRVDAITALRDSDGDVDEAHEVCASIARSVRNKLTQETPILPTRDTVGSKQNMQYLITRYMQSQKGSANYYESKVVMNRIRS